ncbi:relaxase/mobilization nuclease domain-containing protein [Actinomadura sp. 9N215]|uniref:relaxase/mobilization nuclease domain-containing protein n=1 Tax=Actinomadura sp. 9N215 TaxID=3375150 RepID=UPI0037B42FF0
MIGKVLRGKRVQGLIRYLYGPGRCGEHHDPHIVAGFRSPAELEPALRADGRRDFRRLDGLLTQPLALLGERNYRKPVWHLSARAAPEDPILSDRQWAEVAQEMMSRTGLAGDGDEDAVRWIAVRHADDHVHIVATLARADGVRPEVWNDGYRIRDACREMERRFGLRRTAPADRTAARRPKRAETEKAARVGRVEPARGVLRRHVSVAAAGARTEAEFFGALGAEGVLVRKRYSTRAADGVTGYAVALVDDVEASGRPVWFGGGRLAADLTLPKLRRRWAPEGADRPGPRSPSGPLLSARTVRGVLRTAVRRAAGESQTTNEFVRRLEQQGLLVRLRYSKTDPEQITGYAVALADSDEPVWYSGGRLADDLTLPRLRRGWDDPAGNETLPADNLTHEERQAFYDDAARAAAYATSHVRRHLVTNPLAAEDACWAASDVLHVAAEVTGNRHLRRAADTYDRAARAPYGRIPRPTSEGNALRTSARLLTLAGVQDRMTLSVLALVGRLITLLETVAQIRRLQQRQAQAAAARHAYRHLERAQTAAEGHRRTRWDELPARSQAQLAIAGFPSRWAPVLGAVPVRTPPTSQHPSGDRHRGRRPS